MRQRYATDVAIPCFRMIRHDAEGDDTALRRERKGTLDGQPESTSIRNHMVRGHRQQHGIVVGLVVFERL